MRRFNYKIEDGEFRTPGIDWGPKNLEVKLICGLYALLKCFGHTAWAGRCFKPEYRPTQYMIVRLGEHFAEQLLVVEPGHKWKVIYGIMYEMVFNMGVQSDAWKQLFGKYNTRFGK